MLNSRAVRPHTTILKFISAHLTLGALILACVSNPASAGLVGHWVADDWAGGTANWTDRVGGNIATVSNAANSATKTLGVLNDGVSSSALVFDGRNDYFAVAASQNPIAGKTSVTIAAFFNATAGASGADGAFWRFPGPLNAEAPGSPNDWGLTYDAAGNARGLFNNGVTPTPAVSLIDGQAHTMMMTWQSSSAARFYVDGTLIGSTGPYSGSIVNNKFVIGSETEQLLRYFSGAIGELRFYDSVEDVAALHSTMSNSVPEPSTFALLALGLLGVGFVRKQRGR